MKKGIILILLAIFSFVFMGISVKAYTINDYVAKLKNNDISNETEGKYLVNYNDETGKITITARNNENEEYSYELDYNKDTEEISHTNTKTEAGEKLIDSIWSSYCVQVLFNMHGYTSEEISTILESESNYNKYNINIQTSEFSTTETTEYGTSSFSGDMVDSISFKLNDMEDSKHDIIINNSNSKEITTTGEQVEDDDLIKNPQTGDIKYLLISLFAALVFVITIITKNKLLKIGNK